VGRYVCLDAKALIIVVIISKSSICVVCDKECDMNLYVEKVVDIKQDSHERKSAIPLSTNYVKYLSCNWRICKISCISIAHLSCTQRIVLCILYAM